MVNRQPLETGAVLSNEYEIRGVLGQGGFGITYDARDVRLDTRRAVKEYFPHEMSRRMGAAQIEAYSGVHNEQFVWGRSRFVDEGKLIARFSHPGIVKVIRLFEENNTAYMVLDFVEGETLEAWAQRHPQPAADTVMELVRRLLDALEEIHGAHILHRDISPDNVMIRSNGDPVYIDFGAARSDLGSRTKTFVVIRAGYSPSEQHSGLVQLQGAWTDLYSLGATLYRVVTGHAPVSGLARSAGDTLEPASVVAAGRYPDSLLQGIDTALRMHMKERPQTVADLRRLVFAEPPAVSLPRPPVPPARDPTPPPSPAYQPGVVPPRDTGFLRRMFGRTPAPHVEPPPRSAAGVHPMPSPPRPAPSSEDDKATQLATEAILRAQQAEDNAAWAEASGRGTLQAWQGYQARFPASLHGVEAQSRIAARRQNRLIKAFSGHAGAVHAVALAADGQSMLSGGNDGTVRHWDLATGATKLLLRDHGRPVRVVSFLPDVHFAISAGDDRAARLWSLDQGKQVRAFDRHDSEVLSLAVTADGLGIVTGTRFRSVMRWELNSGRAMTEFDQHNGPVTAIAISPNGQLALTGGHDRVLRLHTMPTLALLRPLGLLDDAITSIAVAPDGVTAVSGSAGGVIQVWALRAQAQPDGHPAPPRLTLRGHEEAVRAVAFAAEGRVVVSGGRDGTLRLWRTDTGVQLLAIKAGAEAINAVAAHTQHGTVVTAANNGTLSHWDLSDFGGLR